MWLRMRAFLSVLVALNMLLFVLCLGEVRDEDILDIAFGMIAGIRSLHEQRVLAFVSLSISS